MSRAHPPGFSPTKNEQKAIIVDSERDKKGNHGYHRSLFVGLTDNEYEALQCARCHLIARTAQRVEPCQHLFCRACLQNHSYLFGVCLGCKKYVKHVLDELDVRAKVDSLKARCPREDFTGTLAELVRHYYTSCKGDPKLKRGQNKSAHRIATKSCNFCAMAVKHEQMDKHLLEDCKSRLVNCEHCQKGVQLYKLEAHRKKCPHRPYVCPKCNEQILHKDGSKHIGKDCPNVVRRCGYNQFGCEEKCERRHMKEHLELSATEHLDLVKDAALDMSNKIMDLVSDNRALKKILRQLAPEAFEETFGEFDDNDDAEANESSSSDASDNSHLHQNGHRNNNDLPPLENAPVQIQSAPVQIQNAPAQIQNAPVQIQNAPVQIANAPRSVDSSVQNGARHRSEVAEEKNTSTKEKITSNLKKAEKHGVENAEDLIREVIEPAFTYKSAPSSIIVRCCKLLVLEFEKCPSSDATHQLVMLCEKYSVVDTLKKLTEDHYKKEKYIIQTFRLWLYLVDSRGFKDTIEFVPKVMTYFADSIEIQILCCDLAPKLASHNNKLILAELMLETIVEALRRYQDKAIVYSAAKAITAILRKDPKKQDQLDRFRNMFVNNQGGLKHFIEALSEYRANEEILQQIFHLISAVFVHSTCAQIYRGSNKLFEKLNLILRSYRDHKTVIYLAQLLQDIISFMSKFSQTEFKHLVLTLEQRGIYKQLKILQDVEPFKSREEATRLFHAILATRARRQRDRYGTY